MNSIEGLERRPAAVESGKLVVIVLLIVAVGRLRGGNRFHSGGLTTNYLI